MQQANANVNATGKQMNSGSTTTTPITSPALDYCAKSIGETGVEIVAPPTAPPSKNLTAAQIEIENSILHTDDANVNSPPSSLCSTPSPKVKRVKYAKEPKVHGRNKLEPSSEKARVRRQASTLSTCSDKVMILGDVAIKEPKIIASITHHSNNNKLHHSNNYSNNNRNQSSDFAALKTNGSTTPNTAIAITTLSPTSRLSLDMSNSTTVVTHLHNPKMKSPNKKFRFSPFSKQTLSPPLIDTVAMTTITSPSPPTRCRPQFCTSLCSCSSSFRNEDYQHNRKHFVAMYDDCDCTESEATFYRKNTKTKYCTSKLTTCDTNCLKVPPAVLHHCHNKFNFNTTTTTSTAHIWDNTHHQQQVHVCM